MAKEVQALGRTAKNIAANIGEELIKVRASKPDGGLRKWVEDNCSFERRMADNYITVFEMSVQHVAHFKQADSIREVIALGKAKPEPKQQTRPATLNDLRKVERLRALRDDPAATEGENAAAQSKLDDIEKEIGKVEPEDKQARETIAVRDVATKAA